MIKKEYHWNLALFSDDHPVMRYCSNCGKRVIFKDSKLRRRNANGKTIYEYAIYKCGKDHTWNRPMGKYPSYMYQDCLEIKENVGMGKNAEALNLSALGNDGIKEIEIFLGEVIGKWRLDKLLGDRIQGISRNKVCKMIRLQRILLDGQPTQQDALLRTGQKITIWIED
jgi:Uncharacterized protein conserved in bacteria